MLAECNFWEVNFLFFFLCVVFLGFFGAFLWW